MAIYIDTGILREQLTYHSTMISLRLLVASALFATVFSASCPAGWIGRLHKCYKFTLEKQTWTGAREMCKLHNSELMSIETEREQAMFVKIAQTFNHTDEDDGFWLSGSDWSKEGTWMWESTGQPVTWSTWGQGQPNNRNNSENCMAAVKYFNYKWSDEFCDWDHHIQYVCEKPVDGAFVVG